MTYEYKKMHRIFETTKTKRHSWQKIYVRPRNMERPSHPTYPQLVDISGHIQSLLGIYFGRIKHRNVVPTL